MCSGKMFNMAKPYLLTIALQFGMAGTYIFSMASLNHGMSRYVFVVYRNAIAAISLAPFALIFERPVVDQGFTFLGMQYTSASFASAIMNAVPSVTFVLAIIFRIERIKIMQFRSQVKVIGTLVSFGGAMLMTLYKGPEIHMFHSETIHHQHDSHSLQNHKNWVIGTLFILLGCVAWSSFYILQSITVKKYPAELSLSALICLMGALQSAVVALVADHRPQSWVIGWDFRLFGPLYTGIVSSGISYYVQGLVMQSRGPVFLTAFNPLCMIIVSALGSFFLGEHLHLGRMESMRIKQLGCQAKVIGTVVSLGGALLMAMYKGPLVNIMKSSTNHVGQPGNVNDPGADHWVMGACFLLIGCAGFSCFYILQGIVTSAIQFYVQGKVIKTTGPVFVTAFNPLRMIIVTALACILLAEKLYLGSIIGGVVVVMGLYLVVWGKSKEQKKHLIPQSPEKEINLQLPVTVPINESNNDNKTQFVADKNNDIEA
ncbi:hypothetical protein TanjilG_05021 [Lupinus angustifolius]|uniref:EamA domain-containing protein n=1 Tax=Lupinus angustifolius TaxID=3871 RepID=A0A4P1R5F5_LUPAN|nr:hypothetical protein TanjilG_05021 [Lupinus angustifolius]